MAKIHASTLASLLSLAAIGLLHPPAAPGDENWAENGPGRGARDQDREGVVEWLPLDDAIRRVRKEYLPLLVRFDPAERSEAGGGDPSPEPVRFFDSSLADPAVRKLLHRFACVQLSRADLDRLYPLPSTPSKGVAEARKPKKPAEKGAPEPPEGEKEPEKKAESVAVAARLGLVEGEASLLLVDFRERVARRYWEKAPAGPALAKDMARFAALIEAQASAARRVEKILEESEYAYAVGETREGILKILPLDDAPAQRGLDAELLDRLSRTLGRFREDAARAIDGGTALEADHRYLEAVEAYRKVQIRFPFPDVIKKAGQKQGAAFRKAQEGR